MYAFISELIFISLLSELKHWKSLEKKTGMWECLEDNHRGVCRKLTDAWYSYFKMTLMSYFLSHEFTIVNNFSFADLLIPVLSFLFSSRDL